MISITSKSPYAHAALVELAGAGEDPVPIGELARRRDIPAQFLQPIRVALSGTTVSPGIFETLEVLGREESLKRIDAALAAGPASD